MKIPKCLEDWENWDQCNETCNSKPICPFCDDPWCCTIPALFFEFPSIVEKIKEAKREYYENH